MKLADRELVRWWAWRLGMLTVAAALATGCSKAGDDTTPPTPAETSGDATNGESSGASNETASPAPVDDSLVVDTADPHQMAFAQEEIAAARELIMKSGGFTPEIVAGLKELHRRYPQHEPTTDLYGRALDQTRQWGALADLMLERPASMRSTADNIKAAQALIQVERYDEAAAVIEPVLEAHPDRLDAARLAATATFHSGDSERAAVILDTYWDRFVDARWFEILHLRGVAHLQAGETDKGIELLEEMIKLVPEHSLALEALGRALLERGDTEIGQKHLDQAAAARATFQEPEAVALRVAVMGRAAAAAAQQGDYDQCLSHINELLPYASDKDLIILYQLRAGVLKAQGKDALAAESQAQARRLMEKQEAADAAAAQP